MSILTGFVILSEERNELTDKLIHYLESNDKEKYCIIKDGIYPRDWFKKNSHFSRKWKSELKIFIEVSFRGRVFKHKGKETSFDIETFSALNKIINENVENKLYLFPFQVNNGIKKLKPKILLEEWKGKLI